MKLRLRLCLPCVQTERHKKSFIFSTTKLWNSIPSEMRLSSSLRSFKTNLLKCLGFPSRNYLFYVGDRSASIFHTRLRLNFSALNHDLFKKNCSVSTICTFCDAPIEDAHAKHYFLYCPSFSVLRVILFASAVNWINGVPDIDFQINVNLFKSV